MCAPLVLFGCTGGGGGGDGDGQADAGANPPANVKNAPDPEPTSSNDGNDDGGTPGTDPGDGGTEIVSTSNTDPGDTDPGGPGDGGTTAGPNSEPPNDDPFADPPPVDPTVLAGGSPGEFPTGLWPAPSSGRGGGDDGHDPIDEGGPALGGDGIQPPPTTAATPEPVTITLSAIGLGLLGCATRRRRV